MEWITALYGTAVGLDTAPLIYFIEKHPSYLFTIHPLFEAAERGDLNIVTSTLTLTEVLVHPYRRGNTDLALRYSQVLLNARNVLVQPVSGRIADEAARIRAAHGCKTPDAIQLATAICGGAASFVTNDGELPSLPGLNLIVLDRLISGQ